MLLDHDELQTMGLGEIRLDMLLWLVSHGDLNRSKSFSNAMDTPSPKAVKEYSKELQGKKDLIRVHGQLQWPFQCKIACEKVVLVEVELGILYLTWEC